MIVLASNYACPLCCHSAVDMTNHWRYLDEEVAATQMPDEYRDMTVWILCRDCHQVTYRVSLYDCYPTSIHVKLGRLCGGQAVTFSVKISSRCSLLLNVLCTLCLVGCYILFINLHWSNIRCLVPALSKFHCNLSL